ncbi:MAG: DUF4007 family protein [Candidatus Methylumidiphilus sp.]
MQYTPEKTSFGRHETFPLRFGWLTKGYANLRGNPALFLDPAATVTLGVGKNMVHAIAYWMQAMRLIEDAADGMQATALGNLLLGEHGDPYLEDEATIWILHWLLASNPQHATGFFWFFNLFQLPRFSEDEARTALANFVRQSLKKKANTTLKSDINTLLRMYSPTAKNDAPSEDSFDSPLSLLRLIQLRPGRQYLSSPGLQPNLPSFVLGYAVAELFAENPGKTDWPVRNLLRSDGQWPAPGAVFRLSEEGLLHTLETFIAAEPGHFELRETVGLHQIHRLPEASGLNPLALLAKPYHPV